VRTCIFVTTQWPTESLKLGVSSVKSGTPLASALKNIPNRIIRGWENPEGSLTTLGRNACLPADVKKTTPPKDRTFTKSWFWTCTKSRSQVFCSNAKGTHRTGFMEWQNDWKSLIY
jgi:hypothetical protein